MLIAYAIVAVLAAAAYYWFVIKPRHDDPTAPSVEVPAPATTPPPAPMPMPADTYPSVAALVDALSSLKFDEAVHLDGKEIWPGFGPAIDYTTQPDGSLKR